MSFAGGIISGHLTPSANTWNLGGNATSSRFGTVYLVNAPNVSSDARLKEEIEDISSELIDFVCSTPLKKYKLKSDGSTHFGIIIEDEIFERLKEIGVDNLIVKGDDGLYSVAYTEWQNIILEGVRRSLVIK